MEQEHFFTGGLSTDTDPQYQPKDTYRYAENLIFTAGGHLLQEKGATLLPGVSMPVVGATALNGQEILFSTNGSAAEIGVLDGDTYTVILHSDAFTLGPQVRATAKIDYRGHSLVYWGDGASFRWLDLDAPTTNLPAGLDVIANPISPIVSLSSVQAGGNLPTGVYQATACLLTASKNETSYGLFTGVIPVLDEDPLTSASNLLDGAPPQKEASGSIIFSLTNLDPSYSYVQLVVATYTGVANTLELHKLPPIAINGRTSLEYTYYSFSQHEQPATLSEVLGELPNYVSATEVLQKDGHLLAAGLTTAPGEDIDWQAIANNIILGPTIKTVPFSENVNITHYQEDSTIGGVDTGSATYNSQDYKNPLLTETGKSLQRGEVYSFCFTPIINGRRGNSYHIPASTAAGAFAAYTSLETYPTNQGYPNSGGVLHHRMPTLVEQPLLDGNNIRILGIQELTKPDFSLLTASQQGSVTGYLIGMQKRLGADRSILAQGIVNPLQAAPANYALYVSPFAGQPSFGGGNNDVGSANRLSSEYVAFYSPETSITADPISSATKLSQVGVLNGTSYGVADKRTGGLGEEFAAVFLNYTSFTPGTYTPSSLIPAVVPYVAPLDSTGIATTQSGERYPIMTSGQNGYALLKSETGIPKQGVPDIIYQYDGSATSSLRFRQANGSTPNGDDANWRGVTQRPLYNLLATRTRQYGAVEQATYFPIAYSTPDAPALQIFKGDTFISKVALVSATQEMTDEEPGLRFTTLSYFFCESTVNTNYRYYLVATPTTQGTLPYYPKSKNLWQKDGSGVLQYPTGLGQASGYNKQYSFNNYLTPLLPKDYSITQVTRYDNRILYSALAVEGEQLDAYRSFRVNDYHDIPKDKGPITSLADVSGKLYAHTTDCLYRSFFNDQVTQESSEGEVTLGNGGLFNRPSTPVLTIDGGYAGSQHAPAAVTASIGHFFPDAKRGKVFLLSDGLKELTKDGLTATLREKLQIGTSYRAAYDYLEERYILAGVGFPSVSWSGRNQRWVSFHSYSPNFMFSTAIRNLQAQGSYLFSANTGDVLASSLTIITNQEPEASKVFGGTTINASSPPSQVALNTLQQARMVIQVNPYVTYGQDPGPSEVLYRFLSDQYQIDAVRDNVGGRLQGKWLKSFWVWPTTLLPATIRLLSNKLSFRAR